MLIDFHSHILPGIDDGSSDLDCTEGLLREELRQGIDVVLATPHFYASHVSIHDFLVRRDRAFEKTQKMCSEKGIHLPIYCGAEVYYFPGIGDADKMRELTIAGSDILLLEMPFAQWNEDVYQDVKKILYKQGLRVVLAHLERYFEFQKNKNSWIDILNLPVTVQLNAGCAFERKKRKFALKVLDSDLSAVLGSDCHNLTSRRPNLDTGRAALEKSVGAARMARMDAEAEALLTRIPGWASGSFK